MREWCFFPNFLGLKYIICSRYLECCFSRCLALSFWRVSRDLQTGFASCKIVSDRRGHGCFPLILLTFLDLRVPPASTWYCYYFVVFIDLFICLFFIYTFIHYHIARFITKHFVDIKRKLFNTQKFQEVFFCRQWSKWQPCEEDLRFSELKYIREQHSHAYMEPQTSVTSLRLVSRPPLLTWLALSHHE